ncbi:hypothetical protein ACRALDRAFT_1082875 [Sodiomyces alcalophilus JCM 7366]|uniref:uncharacterized protein n=1 Tax=Sodiomyces alcalophilus JCM 7366 TaxID=591952 RepID=UPI0039B58796
MKSITTTNNQGYVPENNVTFAKMPIDPLLPDEPILASFTEAKTLTHDLVGQFDDADCPGGFIFVQLGALFAYSGTRPWARPYLRAQRHPPGSLDGDRDLVELNNESAKINFRVQAIDACQIVRVKACSGASETLLVRVNLSYTL